MAINPIHERSAAVSRFINKKITTPLALTLLMNKIKITPAREWVDPNNPTIRGDANIFGELIPGRIFGGGIPPSHVKLEKMIDALLPLGNEYSILRSFKNIPDVDPFWRYLPPGHVLRIARRMIDIETSMVPEGHIIEDAEVAVSSNKGDLRFNAGIRTTVSRDFTGSLVRILELLMSEHWEIRFMKDFRIKKNEHEGYMATYVFTHGAGKDPNTSNPRIRYHGLFEIAHRALQEADGYDPSKGLDKEPPLIVRPENRAGLEACLDKIKKHIIEEDGVSRWKSTGSDFIETSEEMIKFLAKEKLERVIACIGDVDEKFRLRKDLSNKIANEYLNNVLPQIFFAENTRTIAENVVSFYKMQKQSPRVVVSEPHYDDYYDIGSTTALTDPTKIKILHIAIKQNKITPLLVKICHILKERNIDIRYFLIESIDQSPVNRTLCKIGIQDNDGNPISYETFKTIKNQIEELGNPTFGVKSLLHDILGPKMIGPSSSHTAGACKIGLLSRNIFKSLFDLGVAKAADNPHIEIDMVNTFSLSNTGAGHYSHRAVCGGLLGNKEDDEALCSIKAPIDEGESMEVQIGKENIKVNKLNSPNEQDPSVHPNTIKIRLVGKNGSNIVEVAGASVGGGIIGLQSINGEALEFKDENKAIRGNRPLYLIKFKEGKTKEDLANLFNNIVDGLTEKDAGEEPGQIISEKEIQPTEKDVKEVDMSILSDFNTKESKLEDFVETLKNLVMQVKDAVIGDQPLTLLCCRSRVNLDHPMFSDIIEKHAVVDLVGEMPSEKVINPEFSSFATLLQAVEKRKLDTLSEYALGYEERLATRRPGEKLADVRARILNEMFEHRLNVMKQSKEVGSKLTIAISDVNESGGRTPVEVREISNLASSLLTYVDELPISPERLEMELETAFKIEPGKDLMAKLSERSQPPFDPYVGLRRLARDSFISKALERVKDTAERDAAFYSELYADLKEAWKLNPLRKNIFSYAMAYAEAVNMANASMGKIVAAPTAGSAGVIPGVLLAMQEFYKFNDEELFSDEKLTKALFTAALIGLVINDKVPTAGGTGGCQAELGAATAMAAGAATELFGGSPKQVIESVALSLQFMEGLVCDPVAGFVVWPCILRNGFAANVALSAAWQAVNLRESLMSADSVVEALADVAEKMHYSLKELGKEGGLAGVPEGEKLGETMRKPRCLNCIKC